MFLLSSDPYHCLFSLASKIIKEQEITSERWQIYWRCYQRHVSYPNSLSTELQIAVINDSPFYFIGILK